MEIARLKIQWLKKGTVARADQKYREIDDLFSGRRRCIVRRIVTGEIEIPVQKALAVTHRDGLLFINAKHFGDVLAVQLKIGDDPQLVKALQGH